MNTKYDPKDLARVPNPEWGEYRNKIEEYIDGYRAFRVLETSANMGIFDNLAHPSDKETLAKRIGADPAMTGLLCDCLTEMGLLIKEGDLYSNAPAAELFFTESSPFCQKESIAASAERMRGWETLVQRVQDGPEIVSQKEFFGEKWITMIATGARGGSTGKVITYLEEHLGHLSGTMTDVGGGHGLYMIGLCARHPELKGRVFDRPRILKTAEKYCRDYGVPLELVPGDLYEDPIPGGNDLMFISFNPACSDPKLVPNIAAALSPGGRLAVRRHTAAATTGALRNLEWNLRAWDGFRKGDKRHSAAASNEGDVYIEELAKAGIALVSREGFDRESEMLVFEKRGPS